MSIRITLVAALATATALTGTANAAVFNLAGSVGATPTFAITSGGQTATFTSPAGNGFTVQSTSGLFSFSPALIDNNFFGTDSLTISFSTPVTNEILIPFAIQDGFSTGGDTLTAITSAGTTRTFTTTPDGLPLGEPEGTIAFVPNNPTSFITLSSAQGLPFAIGNVTVPEPMSLSLLGLSLVGMAAIRRRRSN